MKSKVLFIPENHQHTLCKIMCLLKLDIQAD